MDEIRDPKVGQALEAALEAMRRTLRRPPEEYVAQRHLSAMRTATAPASVATAPRWTPRWLATGVAALLGFLGGLAATDTLPNPAQHLVAQLVGHVGVNLPDPDGEAKGLTKDHENAGDEESESEEEGEEGEGGAADHDPNHGDEVKAVAQDDTLEGCEHGQAVREVASNKNNADADAPGQSSEHDPCAHTGGAGTTGEGEENSQGDEHRHQGGPAGDSDGPGESDGAGNSENAGSGPPSDLGGDD